MQKGVRMKIVIVSFNKLSATSLEALLKKNHPSTEVGTIPLPETNWVDELDYDRIKPHKLSSELDAIHGDLVGQLTLAQGAAIFDLRAVNGKLPQNGSELFVTIARNFLLERSAALIDDNWSTAQLSGLFTSQNCMRRPNVSTSAADIINWFDNINNLIAA
jgi:hypothetical protein